VVDCETVAQPGIDLGNLARALSGRSSRDERPSKLRAGKNSVPAGTVVEAFDGITGRAIFDRS
jgi:hypothetical protein